MAVTYLVFWLFTIIGVFVSYLASIFTHNLFGIPSNVQFYELGLVGIAAQLTLLALPFATGAFVAGLQFSDWSNRVISNRGILKFATIIGLSVLALTLPLFVLSGVWFGIIQGPAWMGLLISVAIILGPPLFATFIVWMVFLTTVRARASRRD
ncbi:hypothetical protein [Ruegeria arenilitoris]|uniref:hypothetical protein n=1 Tax=Ruegeria arenilitoris TaxID=1173585 RepID=UPI00147A008C|nr:hypothetical protein [Ruegeria arenilitoris]